MEQFPKTYQHQEYEAKWYDFWLEKDYFHGDEQSSKPGYSIIIPPPNVTDRLHMGHGLNNTIQDVLIRYKRMNGFEACWLPGTDHAGIATQMMVEKALAKENKTKDEIGREAFLKLLHDWKDENGGIIINQLKKLGCSADWKREAYTMSEGLSTAVREIFVRLYEDGLIYRGKRLVNWDPGLLTAISDDEVENIEKQGKIYHINYPLEGGGFVEIATTRPETILGDSAIAVHPDDDRYKQLVGSRAKVPFCDRWIPVVADEYVKMDFGSGALKITPAHDFNDFEVGKRHQLEVIDILTDDASLNQNVPKEFQGLDRFEARDLVVSRLKEEGLLLEIKNHKMTIPISSRSKSVIEPKLSLQWYVKMDQLAKPAIKAAKAGDLNFYPAAWQKTYLHWLENIQDWCISRQLWWGHRIPIWYCSACNHEFTGRTDPGECEKCSSREIKQDEDVLDTWFSSWLWPISPFGWPEQTKDLEKFYPSNVLVTGADIIFLWVARMVMMSQYVFKKNPFGDIYFNSIICDKEGKKFSKTLGNGIDPLEMIDRYGADAVRFTCMSMPPLRGRVRMDKEDFLIGSKFINKIWNASKLVVQDIFPGKQFESIEFDKLSPPLQHLLYSYNDCVESVRRNIDHYRIDDAVSGLYHFIWNELCDWSLEYAKLQQKNGCLSNADASALLFVFKGVMLLAHPVLPFITEEINSYLPDHPDQNCGESLCISDYPGVMKGLKKSQVWEAAKEIVVSTRKLRAQLKLKKLPVAFIKLESSSKSEDFSDLKVISDLSGVEKIEFVQEMKPDSLVEVGRFAEVCVPMPEGYDKAEEIKRLEKEKLRISKILTGIAKKLTNKKFVENAPKDILAATNEQKQNLDSQLKSILRTLQGFS